VGSEEGARCAQRTDEGCSLFVVGVCQVAAVGKIRYRFIEDGGALRKDVRGGHAGKLLVVTRVLNAH